MHIQSPAHVHGPQAINAPHAVRGDFRPAAPPAEGVGDELQLSSVGQFVDRAGDLPAIRQDRVAELKAAIAGGRYETPARIEGAINRLLDELA
jgi:anti-sigma28 factor (negative regulator of flagellin synthesis)